MASSTDRVVREPERKQITGRSSASWWRDERDGKAPRRIQIGDNAVGWLESELNQWVASRVRITQENSKPVAPGAKRGRKPSAVKEV